MTAQERADLTVAIGDAIHQELPALIEQHTRRMMVAALMASKAVPGVTHGFMQSDVDLAVATADRIMKTTEEPST